MSTTRRRRSYEAGHKPKFLVVIDDTPECDRAVYFASPARGARRRQRDHAARDRDPRPQPAMARRRRHHEGGGARGGQRRARQIRRRAPTASPASPPSGWSARATTADEILGLIDEDEDIAILVLAAGTGKDGPGAAGASFGDNAGDYPIPVAIVPGHLSDEELDALT